MNIVATLHQPRQEILDLIDTLILLAPGGRLAFFGPPSQLKDHFGGFGYNCPLSSNVADFVMDVLAGFVVPAGKSVSPPVKETNAMLCDHWEATMLPQHSLYMQNEVSEIASQTLALRSTFCAGNEVSEVYVGKANADIPTFDLMEYMFNFRKTVYVSFSRQKKAYNRSFESIISVAIMLFIAGFVVGIILKPVRLSSNNFNGSAPNLIFQTIVGQLTFGLLTLIWGLQLFIGDELMRNREMEGGISLLPLVCGKIFASYVELWFFALAFVMGYYPTLQSNASFAQYWGIFLLVHMPVSALGNLLAVCVPGSKRDLAAMAVLIALWLFGGVMIPYPSLVKSLPGIGPLLNALSPFKWSFELQMVIELSAYDEIWDELIDAIYHAFYFHPSNLSLCVGMLFVYWFIANMLCCLILFFQRDNYRLGRLCWDRMVSLLPQFNRNNKGDEKFAETKSPIVSTTISKG